MAAHASGRAITPAALPLRRAVGVGAVFAAIAVLSLLRVSVLHSPLVFDDLFGRDATRVFGHARFVRGDEFAVETPVALGQARAGFPEHMTIGRGQDADVHAYAPGSWGSVIFRPLNVWFRLLAPDAAVIARSWSVFAVGCAAFWALVRTVDQRLRRGVVGLLVIGAVFSPPMMWWFTTSHWLAVSFGILGPLALLQGRTRGRAALAAAGGAYLLGIGAMTTYPAFFLACAAATGLIVAARFWTLRALVLRGVIAGVCGAVVAGTYYAANRDAFSAVLNTVYPGGRTSVSGEDSFLRAFSGPFLRYLLSDVPTGYANQAEHAAPLYVFGLAFLAVVVSGRWRAPVAVRRCASGAIAALVVLWGWALGGLPAFVGRLIGFGGVPGARTVMALVIVSTALGASMLGSASDNEVEVEVDLNLSPTSSVGGCAQHWGLRAACPEPPTAARNPQHGTARRFAILAGSCLAIGVGLVGWEGWTLRRRVGPAALALREVVLYTVLFAVVVVVVVASMRATLRAGAVALLSIGITLGVHPLSIGMGSGDRVAREIRSADALAGHPGWWIADDDVRLNAVVVASGVRTWTGVHFFPDRSLWKVLDPTGVREHEWNRYAHVVFRLKDGADERAAPTVTAVQSDAIIVEIGVCRPELRTLDVAMIVSRRRLVGRCVTPPTSLAEGRLWLTELASS